MTSRASPGFAVSVALVACSLGAAVRPARAEPERGISYFFPIMVAHDAYSFRYTVETRFGDRPATAVLDVEIDAAGKLTARLDGGTAATTQLPAQGGKGGNWSVVDWLLAPDPTEPPLKGARTALDYSVRFFVRAPRSHWEDGFVANLSSGSSRRWFTFGTDTCEVGDRKGRVARVTDPAVTIDACLSPDINMPLSMKATFDKGSATMVLSAYSGPPAPRGNLAWYCDADCGPPPRRPPALGTPAPELRVSRWLPAGGAITVAGSTRKVLVVQSCFLDESDCRTTGKQLDTIRAAHKAKVLVATLAPDAPHRPGSTKSARELVRAFGVKHPIGLESPDDAAANEAAYDLDDAPIAWVIAGGKLVWYGRWLDGAWIPGNHMSTESLRAKDVDGLAHAVEAALGGDGTASGTTDAVVAAAARNAIARSVVPRVVECQDRGAAGVTGTLTLSATIRPDGHGRATAGDARLVSSTVHDAAVETCAVGVLSGMSFAVPAAKQRFAPFTIKFPVALAK